MKQPIRNETALVLTCRHRYLPEVLFVLAFLGLSQMAQAVLPPPDGGYSGGNTAEGQNALLSLTTGGFNTAVGFFSLRSNTTGQFNTATGAGALLANTADNNTATGAGTLLNNGTGDFNTANGAFALLDNTTGGGNTANGASALLNNTEGSNNTATGFNALHDNTTGFSNTANGRNALFANTSGSNNTAIGIEALGFTTSGNNNTAVGKNALENNQNGSGNIALGADAATSVLTASNVIAIGTTAEDVSNSCYIAQIFGATSAGGTAVLINSNGKLGTATSSRRFKEEIKPMEQASEALYRLRPVTFRYKTELDPECTPQFGLIAEEVEEINSNLVVRDKEGKPYTVRYDAVNAMLLNEFLKEHRKNEQQEETITQLKSSAANEQAVAVRQEEEIKALAAKLEEQSAQIQSERPSPTRQALVADSF
ncbi:MAG: tail fiber domain-containing protein [Nitrospirota bacterium]